MRDQLQLKYFPSSIRTWTKLQLSIAISILSFFYLLFHFQTLQLDNILNYASQQMFSFLVPFVVTHIPQYQYACNLLDVIILMNRIVATFDIKNKMNFIISCYCYQSLVKNTTNVIITCYCSHWSATEAIMLLVVCSLVCLQPL